MKKKSLRKDVRAGMLRKREPLHDVTWSSLDENWDLQEAITDAIAHMESDDIDAELKADLGFSTLPVFLVDPCEVLKKDGPREGIRGEIVQLYRKSLREGAEFPPLVIDSRGPKGYILWDGGHRATAMCEEGVKEAKAIDLAGARVVKTPEGLETYAFGRFRESRHEGLSSAVLKRRTALVIVHLSSLDSYTYMGYEAEGDYSKGEELGLSLTEAILNHEGPVYIVDQGWEPDRPESRPRAALLERIAERDDIRWIHFDEADQDWDDFEQELFAALRKDHVTEVIVGGVWYDPKQKEGCATATYFRLKKHFNVRVDATIVGCESDFAWQEGA